MCITIYALTVLFLKFGLKCFIPRENCPAALPLGDLGDELLNKVSYPGLVSPVGLLAPEISCCSFLTPGGFFLPLYAAYK